MTGLLVAQILLTVDMKPHPFRAIMVLMVGFVSVQTVAAEPPNPGFLHHLRATPDVLGAAYATTSASLYLLYGYVRTSDSSGNVVLERHFGYASAAGAALWAIGSTQSVIRSYLDPSQDRAFRRLERVFICAGIAALGLYTLSPQYDGDEARGMGVNLLLPMVIDLAITFIPYPH